MSGQLSRLPFSYVFSLMFFSCYFVVSVFLVSSAVFLVASKPFILANMELTIKVICKDLPGTRFDDEAKGLHYRNVHLGIQRGEEVIEIVPGDSKTAEFAPVFKVVQIGDLTNFTGPFAKGTKDQRFFYLNWGVLVAPGLIHGFRRAKIHLSHLKWADVERAVTANKPIEVHLSLTDHCGWPLCASVKPPYVKWES